MKITILSFILLLSTIFSGCNHSNKPDIAKTTTYEISRAQKITGDDSKKPSCCSTLNKALQKRKATLKVQADCKQ